MASCDAIRQSIITFAYKFYERAVISQKDNLENTFISPLSVYTALSMAMVGSSGATKNELLAGLQMPQTFGSHEAFENLGKTLQDCFKPTDGVNVSLANRIFVDLKVDIMKEYEGHLQKCFGGMIEKLAISSNAEQARSHINSWVEQNTMKKIIDLIPNGSLTPNTLLVLANALYFKGLWEYKFQKENTRDGVFHKLDGSQVHVPFMFQKCKCILASPVLSASRMVRIPFKGSKWEMMLLIPNHKNGLPQLLADISKPNQFQDVLYEEGFEVDVDLHLPKFKLSGSNIDVIEYLSALGIKHAFSTGADFSGMTKTPVSISEVRHKAVLEVDEEGATAAAATAVMMNRCAGPPPVMVDHPFFLALVYDKKIPVFMGHVMEPESL